MRKAPLFVAALALFAGSQTVFAADLPRAAPAPVYVAPVWTWTGFYIGAHAGYGGNEFEYLFNAPAIPISGTTSVTSSGEFAGGQIGYNWQSGNWVFGIEADIAWAAIKAEVTAASGPVTATAGSELEWFGTVRGRLGYTWDRFMLYATGGYAYGSVKNSATALAAFVVPVGAVASVSTTRSGWTVGGGFEYGLTPNWSVKTEYLYIDLGRDTIFSSPIFSIDEDTTVHTIKAGVNYRFGG